MLDSGASFHTTSHKEIMTNYVDNDFRKVYLADGQSLDVMGISDVSIKQPNSSVWKLQKVRYIPQLKKNLISVGQLDDNGHSISFRDGEWKVTKRVMVIAREKKRSTLYMTTKPGDVVSVAASLWHNRLGHMNQKWMKELLSKGKLPELKNVHFGMCESCIMGKDRKSTRLNSSHLPTSRMPSSA